MALPQGAALGATTDPKQLIHGEPAVVESIATYLDGEARGATSRLSDFDSATVRDWTGEAHEAYTYARVAQKKKLEQYADSCKRAAQSFSSFHGALTTAQASAAKAIAKWQEGEQASKAAVDAYNSKVDAYNARVKAQQADPIARAIQLVPPGPFEDPGQALRDEAEKILEDARKKLDDAGNGVITEYTAAGINANGSAKVEEGPEWFKGKGTSPEHEKRVEKRKGNATPGELPEGEDEGKKPGVDASLTVVSGKKEVAAFKAEGESEAHVGGADLKAKGSVDALSAGVEGDVKVGKDGVEAGVKAHAYLVHAEGEASADYGPLSAHAKGEAYVGAEAHAGVGISKAGVHAGGEAFAGGKVTGEVSGDVGGVGAGVEGEAWAGVGVAADLDVGMKDGKFHIGGELGAGLGIGAKIGPNVTLDFPEMLHSGKDMVEDAGKVVDKMTVTPDEVADTGKKIVKGIGGLFS